MVLQEGYVVSCTFYGINNIVYSIHIVLNINTGNTAYFIKNESSHFDAIPLVWKFYVWRLPEYYWVDKVICFLCR